MSATIPTGSKKPYDTFYNRLKLSLALIIIRDKPIGWTVEEYIRFVNCQPLTQPLTGQREKLVEMTKEIKEQIGNYGANENMGDSESMKNQEIENKENVDHVNLDNEKSDSKEDQNIQVENAMEADNEKSGWRKRALELTSELETLKQQLCAVEQELEAVKTSIPSNKRRKKKETRQIKEETEQTIDVSMATSNEKQSGKVVAPKKGCKRQNNPECQTQEADD
ncbi:9392_t:CDS:2, partial [Acaulospora morrowiae]